MIGKKRLLFSVISLGALLLVASLVTVTADEPTPIEELGGFLYFDKNLSTPTGQACADCHDPDFGFDDPDSGLPVSQGVLPKNRFGNRNSPSSAYAMYAPIRYLDEAEGLWIGGQFWDSRATGEVLGDPLADQALGPFLNPLEMNNPSKLIVIQKIRRSDYAGLFEQVWGEGSLDNVEAAYDNVALSIAAFERTELFAPFSSKYDAYLEDCLSLGGDMAECAIGSGDEAADAGSDVFSQIEWDGLQLFMGENDNDGVLEEGEGAMCSACHVADWTAADPLAPAVVVPEWSPDGSIPPLFTDFTYDNLGVPKNPDNPFYDLPRAFNPDGAGFVDLGLGGELIKAGKPPEVFEPELGKVKVMTLRNIADTDPYTHNGFFTSLAGITHFYNTSDFLDRCELINDPEPGVNCWPAPEVEATVNTDELGNLGLTAEEEAAIVAFMKTLSDGYVP